MPRTIRAVYEGGGLRPVERIDLPEQGEVTLVILDDDVAADAIAQLAASGGSFDFLSDPAEDIYTREDGEPSEMAKLRRGDVVLVPFPFTDLTSAKVRPGLIVSADPQGTDLTLAFGSSVVPDVAGPADLVLDRSDPAFSRSGLKRASVFRMSKLVTLDRSLVVRRLGGVTPDVQARVDECLKHALGLSG